MLVWMLAATVWTEMDRNEKFPSWKKTKSEVIHGCLIADSGKHAPSGALLALLTIKNPNGLIFLFSFSSKKNKKINKKEFNLIMINRIYDQNCITDRKISGAQCKNLQFTFTFLPRLSLKMAF